MRRTVIIVALLAALAGCSAGGGPHQRPASRPGNQPPSRPASAIHMLSPAAYKPLDMQFTNELYLYTGLALEMVRQPKAGLLAPAIRQLNEGLTEVQGGYFRELSGWLRQWDQPLPDVDAPPRAIAANLSLSPDGVRKLTSLSGRNYTVGYLNVLMSDEQGALQAATAEQEGGGYGPGRQLATEVVDGSTAVIATIRSMLHQILTRPGSRSISAAHF